MTYKAFLTTKTGEVEGRVKLVYGFMGEVYADFSANGDAMKLRGNVCKTEAAALAHFETHFGRIIRESK